MTREIMSRGHKVMRRTLFAIGLNLIGAIVVTWAWNTVVPDLSDLQRFRFAEGLAIAVLIFMTGLLFGTGWKFVAGNDERPAS